MAFREYAHLAVYLGNKWMLQWSDSRAVVFLRFVTWTIWCGLIVVGHTVQPRAKINWYSVFLCVIMSELVWRM